MKRANVPFVSGPRVTARRKRAGKRNRIAIFKEVPHADRF